MTRFLAALAFLIALSLPAAAQNFNCPDVPPGDSSNRCANTRFVQNHGGGGTSTLTLNHIFIGNGSNVATDTAMTGDCTIVFAGGAITCFATPLPTAKGGLGVNASGASGVPLFLAGAATFVLTNGTGNFVRASGAAIASATISGSAWTGGTITGLPTCSAASDACPKSYIDSVSGGNPPLAPVRLATVAVLSNTPTYANGAAGVGATLTAGSNGALSIDGTVVNLNDRVLVKDQAAQLQNGPYSLTTLGTGGVPYVLTRTTDADTAAELPNRLTMLVTAGATLGGSSWTLNQPAAITVGTTALPFVQTATPSVSYWTLASNDITNSNSGLVKTLGGLQVETASSLWGVNASGGAGGFFGFNAYSDNSGSFKALLTGNRAGYLLFDNSGMALQVSSGTQTASSALSTMIPVFNVDNSGNVGINRTVPSTLLDVSKAVAAGSDNYLLTLRNPTTSIDARAGLKFQINGLATKYGPTISASNDGVTAGGNLLFGNFVNDAWSESIRMAYQGTLGVGTTTPDLTTKMDVVQGTVGSPITSVSHSVQISRTEALASPLDTQGAQNAALNVDSVGTNVSVPGVNIAQPVAILGHATQLGSGDSVAVFGNAQNNGTGTYAAFGAFFGASAFSPSTGAIGIGLSVNNQSGNNRPYTTSGVLYFVGVDAPCSGNAGCSAGYVVRQSGNTWDVGYAVMPGATTGPAFISNNFTVDAAGNVVGLSFTPISDERLKDIKAPFTRGLDDILKINPILFDWKDKPDKPRQAGVSAQDVQRAIPEAVSEIDAEGHLGVSDRPLVAALINSVKELKAANDNLKACQASWRCRIFGP